MSSWDMQLVSIYEKGARACRDGTPIESCPYHGRGLNAQRREYWCDGWKAFKSGEFMKERRRLRDMSW
jgi:hypothetical protein